MVLKMERISFSQQLILSMQALSEFHLSRTSCASNIYCSGNCAAKCGFVRAKRAKRGTRANSRITGGIYPRRRRTYVIPLPGTCVIVSFLRFLGRPQRPQWMELYVAVSPITSDR